MIRLISEEVAQEQELEQVHSASPNIFTYSISIKTKTPPNISSSNAHLNLLLTAQQTGVHDGALMYEWLGTVRPTSAQKLLSIQKSNCALNDNDTSVLSTFDILFFKAKTERPTSLTVWKQLHKTLTNRLHMKLMDGCDIRNNSNNNKTSQQEQQQAIFQFAGNSTHQIVLSMFHTQDFVQCTIRTANGDHYLPIILRLLMEQVPNTVIRAVPMNIHLDMFSDAIRGLLQEIRCAKQLLEMNDQRPQQQQQQQALVETTIESTDLIRKQLSNDLLMIHLVQQTPFNHITYASVL